MSRPEQSGRERAVPLVLNLHGSGSDALGQEGFSGMNATSDARGFVVVYPQALIPDGRGFDWNVPGVPLVRGRAGPAGSANDIVFLTSLVSVLERSYCVDAAHVYVTGFSGGARLASQLGCDTSGVFVAIAPVSGLRDPTPCTNATPIPVMSFHGTADPVDPYDGHGQPYWTYSVADAARGWARHDHCARHTVTGAGIIYDRCAAHTQVVLYTIAGEGHEWPGGPRMPASLTRALGPQSSAVHADTAMWSFFAHYSVALGLIALHSPKGRIALVATVAASAMAASTRRSSTWRSPTSVATSMQV